MPPAPADPAKPPRFAAPAAGWLTRWVTQAAHLAHRLPAQCSICHAWPSQMVCADCNARHAQPHPRCHLCAIRLPPSIDSVTPAMCADCLRHPPPYTRACHAAVSYQWPWRGLIDRFKFNQQPGLATALAWLMVQNANVVDALHHADVWLPMPLHPLRLAERGYNQSWLLAQALHRTVCRMHPLAPPRLLLPNALLRTRHTLPQSTLPFDDRQRNLRNAFAANPKHAGHLAHARVVLLDDVMTTGASLQAAARTLREAGCAQVVAVVLARTEKPT